MLVWDLWQDTAWWIMLTPYDWCLFLAPKRLLLKITKKWGHAPRPTFCIRIATGTVNLLLPGKQHVYSSHIYFDKISLSWKECDTLSCHSYSVATRVLYQIANLIREASSFTTWQVMWRSHQDDVPDGHSSSWLSPIDRCFTNHVN